MFNEDIDEEFSRWLREINEDAEVGVVGEERLTVPSTPPEPRSRGRRSVWPATFSEGRTSPGVWVRVKRTFALSTAGQIASDIRSAGGRAPQNMRVRGIHSGERWEARWDLEPQTEINLTGDLDPGASASKPRYSVWIMYRGNDGN